jgi:hypothetical protein
MELFKCLNLPMKIKITGRKGIPYESNTKHDRS